jgi:hypothetical protein
VYFRPKLVLPRRYFGFFSAAGAVLSRFGTGLYALRPILSGFRPGLTAKNHQTLSGLTSALLPPIVRDTEPADPKIRLPVDSPLPFRPLRPWPRRPIQTFGPVKNGHCLYGGRPPRFHGRVVSLTDGDCGPVGRYSRSNVKAIFHANLYPCTLGIFCLLA